MTKEEFIKEYNTKQPEALNGEAEGVWDFIHTACAGAMNSSNLDDLIIIK